MTKRAGRSVPGHAVVWTTTGWRGLFLGPAPAGRGSSPVLPRPGFLRVAAGRQAVQIPGTATFLKTWGAATTPSG